MYTFLRTLLNYRNSFMYHEAHAVLGGVPLLHVWYSATPDLVAISVLAILARGTWVTPAVIRRTPGHQPPARVGNPASSPAAPAQSGQG